MLHLLTVCALYVCLCDYVNMCMYLVLLCIFGKKLLRACVYCLQKPNSNKVFLSSYLILSNGIPTLFMNANILVSSPDIQISPDLKKENNTENEFV